MTEHYVFPVRYDDRLMRSAVNAFVTRALFHENAAFTFGPLALVVFSCAMLYFGARRNWASNCSSRRR